MRLEKAIKPASNECENCVISPEKFLRRRINEQQHDGKVHVSPLVAPNVRKRPEQTAKSSWANSTGASGDSDLVLSRDPDDLKPPFEMAFVVCLRSSRAHHHQQIRGRRKEEMDHPRLALDTPSVEVCDTKDLVGTGE